MQHTFTQKELKDLNEMKTKFEADGYKVEAFVREKEGYGIRLAPVVLSETVEA